MARLDQQDLLDQEVRLGRLVQPAQQVQQGIQDQVLLHHWQFIMLISMELGKSYDVKIKNVIDRLSYSSADAVNLKLLSTGGTILIDVRRFSCFNSSVEGQTLNNYNLTSTPVDIDSIIYSNSVETHQTRIRQQDPITKLWSLYDVNLFVSANGSRTTIWIYMIAENVDFIVV